MSIPDFNAFVAKHRHLSPAEMFNRVAADEGQAVRWPDLGLKAQCNFVDLLANAPTSALAH